MQYKDFGLPTALPLSCSNLSHKLGEGKIPFDTNHPLPELAILITDLVQITGKPSYL